MLLQQERETRAPSELDSTEIKGRRGLGLRLASVLSTLCESWVYIFFL